MNETNPPATPNERRGNSKTVTVLLMLLVALQTVFTFAIMVLAVNTAERQVVIKGGSEPSKSAAVDQLVELEYHRLKASNYYRSQVMNNQIAMLLDRFAADYTRLGPEEASKKFVVALEGFDKEWDERGHDPLVLIGPEPKTVSECETEKRTEGGGKDEPARP